MSESPELRGVPLGGAAPAAVGDAAVAAGVGAGTGGPAAGGVGAEAGAASAAAAWRQELAALESSDWFSRIHQDRLPELPDPVGVEPRPFLPPAAPARPSRPGLGVAAQPSLFDDLSSFGPGGAAGAAGVAGDEAAVGGAGAGAGLAPSPLAPSPLAPSPLAPSRPTFRTSAPQPSSSRASVSETSVRAAAAGQAGAGLAGVGQASRRVAGPSPVGVAAAPPPPREPEGGAGAEDGGGAGVPAGEAVAAIPPSRRAAAPPATGAGPLLRRRDLYPASRTHATVAASGTGEAEAEPLGLAPVQSLRPVSRAVPQVGLPVAGQVPLVDRPPSRSVAVPASQPSVLPSVPGVRPYLDPARARAARTGEASVQPPSLPVVPMTSPAGQWGEAPVPARPATGAGPIVPSQSGATGVPRLAARMEGDPATLGRGAPRPVLGQPLAPLPGAQRPVSYPPGGATDSSGRVLPAPRAVTVRPPAQARAQLDVTGTLGGIAPVRVPIAGAAPAHPLAAAAAEADESAGGPVRRSAFDPASTGVGGVSMWGAEAGAPFIPEPAQAASAGVAEPEWDELELPQLDVPAQFGETQFGEAQTALPEGPVFAAATPVPSRPGAGFESYPDSAAEDYVGPSFEPAVAPPSVGEAVAAGAGAGVGLAAAAAAGAAGVPELAVPSFEAPELEMPALVAPDEAGFDLPAFDEVAYQDQPAAGFDYPPEYPPSFAPADGAQVAEPAELETPLQPTLLAQPAEGTTSAADEGDYEDLGWEGPPPMLPDGRGPWMEGPPAPWGNAPGRAWQRAGVAVSISVLLGVGAAVAYHFL